MNKGLGLLLSALMLSACGSNNLTPTDSNSIGSNGGTITTESATLQFPAGAVPAGTVITTARISATAMNGYTTTAAMTISASGNVTSFTKSVSLTFKYTEADLTSLRNTNTLQVGPAQLKICQLSGDKRAFSVDLNTTAGTVTTAITTTGTYALCAAAQNDTPAEPTLNPAVLSGTIPNWNRGVTDLEVIHRAGSLSAQPFVSTTINAQGQYSLVLPAPTALATYSSSDHARYCPDVRVSGEAQLTEWFANVVGDKTKDDRLGSLIERPVNSTDFTTGGIIQRLHASAPVTIVGTCNGREVNLTLKQGWNFIVIHGEWMGNGSTEPTRQLNAPADMKIYTFLHLYN